MGRDEGDGGVGGDEGDKVHKIYPVPNPQSPVPSPQSPYLPTPNVNFTLIVTTGEDFPVWTKSDRTHPIAMTN